MPSPAKLLRLPGAVSQEMWAGIVEWRHQVDGKRGDWLKWSRTTANRRNSAHRIQQPVGLRKNVQLGGTVRIGDDVVVTFWWANHDWATATLAWNDEEKQGG